MSARLMARLDLSSVAGAVAGAQQPARSWKGRLMVEVGFCHQPGCRCWMATMRRSQKCLSSPSQHTSHLANTCRVGLAGGQTQRWNLVDLDVRSLRSGLRLSPPWICFYSWHRPPFMLPSRRVDIIHASDPRLDAGSVVAPSFFVFKPMLCCVDFLCQD